MATLKLKPKAGTPHDGQRRDPAGQPARAPVRGVGAGVRRRPTLAEAQAQRDAQAQPPKPPGRREAAGGPPARGSDRRPATPGRPAARGDGPSARRDGPSPRGDARPPRHDARAARGDAPSTRDDARAPRGGERPPRDAEPRPRPPRPSSATRPEPTWQPADHGKRSDPAAPPRRGVAAPDRSRAAPPTNRPNTAFGGPATPRPAHRPPPSDHAPRPPDPARPPAVAAGPADTSLRLSKYLSELGLASRREADEWIPKGWVRVDGRVVAELGSRVLRGQQVTIDAKARHVQAQKVTVLINKPVGYVSGQAEDGYEPAWVLVKPANQWADDRSGIRFLPQHLRSLVPAGRLDIDSVGLLVLTQDGRVAKQLIGEHSPIEKEYLVRVASADGSQLSEQGLALLRHGLELDGQALREAQVEWVNDDQLRFVLREGKKRQIRRMCEAVGLQVLGLKRVRIGQVMLGDLPTGQWRYLRVDEGFA